MTTKSDLPAASPLPEEPPELSTLLETLENAAKNVAWDEDAYGKNGGERMRLRLESSKEELSAAWSALVALFDRQRGVITALTANRDAYRRGWDQTLEEVASLSSQLEAMGAAIDRGVEKINSLSFQLERLKQPFPCNVCGGSGKPTSGLPCICGGVGTEQAELEGFRAQCYDLERSLERLKAEQMEPEEAQALIDYIDGDLHTTPQGWFDTAYAKLRRQSDTGAHQEEVKE